MLSVAEKIAQTAEHIARHSTHGYSQPDRDGYGTETITYSDGTKATIHNGDYDCSEMDRVCVNAAISGNGDKPISYMWSGDADERLKGAGFTRLAFSASSVRRGDVLWCSGHMGIALGDGLQADAHGDENGGLGYGASSGDQTGHEVEVRALRTGVWKYIYRYKQGGSEPVVIPAKFDVRALKEHNVRHRPSTSKDEYITGRLHPGESVTCYGFCQGGKYVWGVYENYGGKTRYIAINDEVLVS